MTYLICISLRMSIIAGVYFVAFLLLFSEWRSNAFTSSPSTEWRSKYLQLFRIDPYHMNCVALHLETRFECTENCETHCIVSEGTMWCFDKWETSKQKPMHNTHIIKSTQRVDTVEDNDVSSKKMTMQRHKMLVQLKEKRFVLCLVIWTIEKFLWMGIVSPPLSHGLLGCNKCCTKLLNTRCTKYSLFALGISGNDRLIYRFFLCFHWNGCEQQPRNHSSSSSSTAIEPVSPDSIVWRHNEKKLIF